MNDIDDIFHILIAAQSKICDLEKSMGITKRGSEWYSLHTVVTVLSYVKSKEIDPRK